MPGTRNHGQLRIRDGATTTERAAAPGIAPTGCSTADERDRVADLRDLTADERDRASDQFQQALDGLLARRDVTDSTTPPEDERPEGQEISRLRKRVAHLEAVLRQHDINPYA